MKADINILDYDNMRLRAPEVVYDLPAGGKRLVQRTDGLEATIVSGAVVYRQGEPTGALPRAAWSAARARLRSAPHNITAALPVAGLSTPVD